MKTHETIRHHVEIRFRDVDAMGHVNNAVFFTYFEEGRKVFLEKVLGIVHASQYPFIMARIECDYRAPLLLGNRPVLEIWIGEIGTRKFTFRYRLRDPDSDDLIYAAGESVMVFYDYTSGRSVPLSPDVSQRIRPFVEETDRGGDVS